MPTERNKAVIFTAIPEGTPVKNVNLAVQDRPTDPSAAPKGGFTYKVNYASYDPYQRGRMSHAEPGRYVTSFDLNEPIRTQLIATVVASDVADYKPGSTVIVVDGDTAEYGVVTADKLGLVQPFKPEPSLNPKLYLGVLGMPGLTAYGSLFEIGKPKKGETIFVSSAAGAVGSLVGQIAKHEGLTVIGSAGSDEKVDYLVKQLGFDAAFNYKKEKPAAALKRLAPKGLDIYYDNVGADHLEAAVDAMNNFGRIVCCGMISQYNLHPTAENPNPGYPIRNLGQIVLKRLTLQGFIVMDQNISGKWAKEHYTNVQKWLVDGSFKARTDTTHGIDNAIDGLLAMLSGNTKGKAVLEVSPLPGWESK